MPTFQSDALVFFGATGDLAYKQIFPSLQGLIRDEGLSVPIIGVAKSGWSIDQLRARAKDSLEHHGGVDQNAFKKLTELLRYVDGDYADAATFTTVRKELGSAKQPRTTWLSRPVCLARSPRGWRNPDVATTRESWLRSLSVTISLRHRN